MSAALDGGRHAERIVRAVWVLIGLLILSLLALAGYLLVRMDFFGPGVVAQEQLKAVWTFLGVALGAAATMIGALLTEQSSRRTAAIASEAEKRQQLASEHDQALKSATERRLSLDTITRALELITIEHDYAPKARIAGAVATMMQLEGGPIAIRILGELWKSDRIDTDTAGWLIERVICDTSASDDDKELAAGLLALNAQRLVPSATDSQQDWYYWPRFMDDQWPSALTEDARNSLLVACVRVLLARERSYWAEATTTPSLTTLYYALEDDSVAQSAASALAKLLDVGFLDRVGFTLDDTDRARIRTLADSGTSTDWYAKLLENFEAWVPEQMNVSPHPGRVSSEQPQLSQNTVVS